MLDIKYLRFGHGSAQSKEEPDLDALCRHGDLPGVHVFPPVEQLCCLSGFLRAQGKGRVPGGHVVSGPAQLRSVPHGG